jgi:hypothetical protein
MLSDGKPKDLVRIFSKENGKAKIVFLEQK